MKLIFDKKKDGNLDVYIRDGLGEKDFSYIEMIKSLRSSNIFEDSEFLGEIAEEEKSRIATMLSRINEVITEKNKDELL